MGSMREEWERMKIRFHPADRYVYHQEERNFFLHGRDLWTAAIEQVEAKKEQFLRGKHVVVSGLFPHCLVF